MAVATMSVSLKQSVWLEISRFRLELARDVLAMVDTSITEKI
jgi:hypothetical protein